MNLASLQNVVVAHAMTRVVVTVRPDASLSRAFAMLRRHRITGMPVVDREGRVVGVLSVRDISRAFAQLAHVQHDEAGLEVFLGGPLEEVDLRSRRADLQELLKMCNEALGAVRVRDVMAQDPILVDPKAPLDEAARIMNERKIRRLPVVSQGKLVGILTRHDVLAAVE